MKTRITAVLLTPFLIIASLFLTAVPAQAAENLTTVQSQILAETNAARAAAGLAPLTLNTSVSAVATSWSEQQASENNMYHNPNVGSQIPSGWSAWGENVAYGYSYTSVTTAWMNSPGHRANILNPIYTEIGIGYAVSSNGTPYYTQNFVTYGPIATIPDVPGNISSSAVTTDGFTVNWNAPGNGGSAITGYTVKITDGGSYSQEFTTGAVNSYTVTELTPGVTYTVQVKATNARGSSVYSAGLMVQTLTLPPSDVTVDTAVFMDGYNADFLFSANSNGSPIITWSATLSDSTGDIETLVQGTNHFTFTTLPGHDYTVTVTATNSVGTSEPLIHFFTAPSAPPSMVTSLDYTYNSSTRTITATWEPPTELNGAPITGYTATLMNADTSEVLDTVNAVDMSAAFTNLERGFTYTVAVTATNEAGSGEPDVTAPETVPLEAPSAVTEPTATNVDLERVLVSWGEPNDSGGSPVTGYQVDIYENSSLTDTVMLDASSTSHTFTVNAGATYEFIITPVNAQGFGTANTTNPVDTPTVITVPDGPQNILTDNITATSVDVSWEPSGNNGGAVIQTYKVNIYTSAGDLVDTANVTSDSLLTWTFGGLQPGGQYYAAVSATNLVGTGPESTTSVFTTLFTAPSAPQNLEAQAHQTDSITISWDAPAYDGGAPFVTYIYTVSDGETMVASENTINTTVNVSGLTSGVTYTVTVTARNINAISPETVTTTVTTPTPPGFVTNLVANTTLGTVTATWEPPTDTGTYPVENYTAVLRNSQGDPLSSVTVPADEPLTAVFTGLAPFTAYSVSVQTFSEITSGMYLDSGLVTTPAELPSEPRNILIMLEGSTAHVLWDAPASDGGAPIQGYRVTLSDSTGPLVTLPVTEPETYFNNLNPNTEYRVSVSAVNGTGTGSPAPEEVFDTGTFKPSSVTSVSAVVDGTQAHVTWDVPDSDGGDSNLRYQVQLFDSNNEMVDTVTTTTLGYWFIGLTRGESYYAQVTASNVAGSADPVRTETVVIPATTPNTPNITTTTVTATTVNITWDTPTYDGGSPVTGYTVTLTDATENVIASQEVTSSEASFSGLTPATEYAVTVTANNVVGSSEPASSGYLETDPTVPNSPTDVMLEISGTTGTATWSVPTYDGGSPILRYEVTLLDVTVPGHTNQSVVSTSADFLNLNPGHTYRVEVTAINIAGNSTVSSSEQVTVPAVVPDAPQNVQTYVNGTTVTVTWEAPTYDGGALVTSYEVTADNGEDTPVTVTVTDLTAQLTGLNPATEYQVSVAAVNTAGTGAPAVTSFTTGIIPPTTPQNATAVLDGGSGLEVTWEAPSNTGGAVISGYTVTVLGPDNTAVQMKTSTTVTPVVFTGLTPGVTYTVTVTARNSVGVSPTATTNPVTVPAVVPSNPRSVTAVMTGPTSATVSWAAPAYDGGAPLLRYEVTATPQSGVPVTVTTTGVDYVFQNLTANMGYVFNVTAVNSAGSSDSENSNPVITAPGFVPPAPTQQELADAPVTTDVTYQDGVLVVGGLSGEINNWFYVWVFSTPYPAGWNQVTAPGVITVNTSTAGLEPGTHRVALINSDGKLVSVSLFDVPAQTINTGNTSNSVTTTTVTNDDLARTGSEFPTLWVSGAGLVLLTAGLVLLIVRRRRAGQV